MCTTRRRSFLSLGALLSGLALCGGCIPINPTPPPEAVLAGVWELMTDQSTDLSQTFWTFGSDGQLTKVQYTVGSITFTDNNPRGRTTVDGKSVTIDATFVGSGQVFNGTLNEDNTVIDGGSGTVIRFGSLVITIDGGDVTLIKQ